MFERVEHKDPVMMFFLKELSLLDGQRWVDTLREEGRWEELQHEVKLLRSGQLERIAKIENLAAGRYPGASIEELPDGQRWVDALREERRWEELEHQVELLRSGQLERITKIENLAAGRYPGVSMGPADEDYLEIFGT
jgi:hypothetical protein